DASHVARGQVVVLTVHSEGHDPVAPRAGERQVHPDAAVRNLVRVARLGAGLRVGTEPEEPPREGPLVPAAGADEAPLLDGDTAVRELAVIEPPSPDEAVVLLSLGRIGEEGAEELPATLLAEVDVRQRDTAAKPDVLREEELRRREARDQMPLED